MASNPMTDITKSALAQYNHDYSASWKLDSNWTNVATGFETFINKYLFPKLTETVIVQQALGNRFDWLAKEVDFIGQYSEEYVILDSVPINMNLSKNEDLMLKRNYPKIASKIYTQGPLKKVKFTLNNNDVRLNFSNLADATSYAVGVYKKRISDINVSEEREIKAMLVEYGLNHTKNKRQAANMDEAFTHVFEAVLNIQNNSEKYNEADTASGGEFGRYTTVSRLADVMILTTDKMKTFLLDSKLANTYQVQGLDLSDRIISFDTLGGSYILTADVTIQNQATIDKFRQMGDYQMMMGDIIPKDSIMTFDVTALAEFAASVTELKPDSDLFTMVFDVNKIRYRRTTKGMLKPPFYNGEFDEVTYWIHYPSFKNMSPFYNSVVITGA